MATMVAAIHRFTSSEAAQAFFDNSIKESTVLDGFFLKRDGFFKVMDGQDTYVSYLDEEKANYIVIAYPKGTAFAIDSGETEPPSPADTSAPDPTPDPSG